MVQQNCPTPEAVPTSPAMSWRLVAQLAMDSSLEITVRERCALRKAVEELAKWADEAIARERPAAANVTPDADEEEHDVRSVFMILPKDLFPLKQS